jgi:AcrR family transcriptional regulator
MVKLSAGEKKRQHILQICKKLFYRNGYAATTYDDICKAADIPPGTITYHFNGKIGIASAIESEYEPQNKIYIEKMCANRGYSKTLLMGIELFHMWKRLYEDANLRRFFNDISHERIASTDARDAIRYFYQCVIDDLGVEGIDDAELELIVGAQIGMSDIMIIRLNENVENYTYTDIAHFTIRFFLRQLGVPDSTSQEIIEQAEAIFETLPIDNRYYRDFAYDEQYLTVLPPE